MTPQEREDKAAAFAILGIRDDLSYWEVADEDLNAATIAVLWRALEMASEGMSKETLRKMIFGEQDEL